MYKYLIEIKKINKAFIYEISMINKSIKNLIIEIDNDNNLDYINEYKDDKYNILFTECKNHLIKYIQGKFFQTFNEFGGSLL